MSIWNQEDCHGRHYELNNFGVDDFDSSNI